MCVSCKLQRCKFVTLCYIDYMFELYFHLLSIRSRQRVFATAESRREQQSDEVEREVVIKKTVHNVNMTNLSDTAVTASYDSSASRYVNASELRFGGKI